MDAKNLARFRRILLQKRRALFAEVEKVETDLQQIAEDREPELEEVAQEERSARVLARLDDRGMAELDEIDRALARIETRNYGQCAGCRKPIPVARLEALPAAPYCRDCTEGLERSGAVEAEAPAPAHLEPAVPPDYNLLSGRELEEAIREHLREDGRMDMEELRIVCRHGVVHLSGSVPSEGEHQIVLQTITDVMGLKDVDDRLRANEILWEREDRNRQEELLETRPWEEQAGTEDVTEAHEEGLDFVPPTRPVPEEE
ncbi:MAG: BON domain-containing protein [Candidatus Binatia bacterium]